MDAVQNTKDDQELAKVLADINSVSSGGTPDLGAPEPVAMPTMAPPAPLPEPTNAPELGAMPSTDFAMPPASTPSIDPVMPATPLSDSTPSRDTSSGSSELDSIKQQALGELRPLVDRLSVSPEEKFDTYLLLLRSTDDKSLIAPAHKTALEITDETKKAQALLDIIKEIDFFSQQSNA